MEILRQLPEDRPKLKVALLDFDGTISTLRYGWESIMEPLMLEMIAGSSPIDDTLINMVKEYIDQSTGIQTIYQMRWLADTVKTYGKNTNASDDPWWYKAEYNKRLMESVEKRICDIESGKISPEKFLMQGSSKFLEALWAKGIQIYVASGTDDPDVKNEAEILGVKKYFKEIAGAPLGRADCSKEATLKRLIEDNRLEGMEVVVIGDGKVEIALGCEVGAITIGLASNEETRFGINEVKRERLVKANAHAITGDFENLNELFQWLNIT
ncbi:MAG: HAD family hydrolase [Clostridiales bacterium]|nr:HAD family hydrolase [Clostridiales bacterium]